jgi:ferric-dicitrate binding protein FerR (iron transport regulator)
MSSGRKNIDHGKDGDGFFSKGNIPFEKTKEEAWKDVSSMLDSDHQTQVIRLRSGRWVYAAAAVIVALVSITGFMRFYRVTIDVPNGEHFTYVLPGGSQVNINARSTLSYHPLLWKFNRELGFEGEAYFDVIPGNSFRVKSEKGTTEVLGTSFNIFSRSGTYRVDCISGKVKVTSKERNQAILSPGYHAEVTGDGRIMIEKNIQPERSISWINNEFSFTGTPFMRVLEEIERQFDVTVIINQKPDLTYTGFFSRDKPVEEVLDLVCKPFGFTFVKKSEGVYQIITNS